MICVILKDNEAIETIYDVKKWKYYNHKFWFYLDSGEIWKVLEEYVDCIEEYYGDEYEKQCEQIA